MVEARARAEVLDPSRLIDDHGGADAHDRAERRNRAYHAAVARHLRRPIVERALHQLWRWEEEGTIDPRYAEAWEEVLRRPLPEISCGPTSQTACCSTRSSPASPSVAGP